MEHNSFSVHWLMEQKTDSSAKLCCDVAKMLECILKMNKQNLK